MALGGVCLVPYYSCHFIGVILPLLMSWGRGHDECWPSDLPSPINTTIADVGEEGLPLLWPKKREVPLIGFGLDGSKVVVSLSSL
ncbi:hypothetical protein ACLOJK_041499 [Asimina triloba]